MIFTLFIWMAAAFCLFFSWAKNKQKTMACLRFAWKSFRLMILLVVMIIWVIGFLLAFLPPQVISKTIGPESGFKGVILAALFGSIALIQAFIAFPLAGSFLRQGANVSAIAAFVTTLVMVGVVTAPLEAKFFGRKFTFWRNFLSFLFALAIAFIMGAVLR